MTGAELRQFRDERGESRRSLSQRTGLHPDTIRYWERQSTVDLRGYGPDLILKAMGLGELSQKGKNSSLKFLAANWVFSNATTRARHGVLLDNEKPEVKERRKLCGARTRMGTSCRARAMSGRARCKFHGGASTGPRTVEGRAKISAAQRRRWKLRREQADQVQG